MKQKNDICPLCNSSAHIIYENLKDNLYGVPGIWSIVRCKSKDCGLAWLSPEPEKEKIKDFYINYYTHEINRDKKIKFKNVFERFLYRILRIIYSLFRRVLFINHDRKNFEYMFLRNKKGKVLEIGCGNGERLYKLKNIGFEVEGLEIDQKAIDIAEQKYGFKIFRGDIRELNFPSQSFDFIIMNHVLEHVFDPVSFLRECGRIVKKGGKIILTTPNFDSYTHKFFKEYWRGLEPPRHLYLYSIKSLEVLCKRAGLVKNKIWTSTAKTEFIVRDSFELYNKIKGINNFSFKELIIPWYLQIKYRLLNLFRKDGGDECILIVEK